MRLELRRLTQKVEKLEKELAHHKMLIKLLVNSNNTRKEFHIPTKLLKDD